MTKTQAETNTEGLMRFSGFKGRYLLQIADQEINLELIENTEKTITLNQ